MGSSWRWSALLVAATLATLATLQSVDAALGTWRLVRKNVGVSAMHTVVAPVVGTVVILEKTSIGPTNLTFPDGRCRNTTYDKILKYDCGAHSIVLDPDTGALRPLMIWKDPFCSSGNIDANGYIQQTGGDLEGAQLTRSLAPECYAVEPINRYCDWQQNNVTNTTKPLSLKYQRWYATNVLLPDGRQIIFGGKNGMNTLEYAPPLATNTPFKKMPFLNWTSDDTTCNTTTNPYCQNTTNGPNNWYPFANLLPNDTIYLFANRDSIMYDYKRDVVVRTYPKIPGNPRNYPSMGSSAMLPLRWEDDYQSVEVLVCGGATNTTSNWAPASASCGRMTVTDPAAAWTMEDMPIARLMGDMVLLPDTTVLIINGAMTGCQGYRSASMAVLNPVLYEPAKPLGQRFTKMDPTVTPRVYHSTANLIPDGSVLVAGSNSNAYYTFTKPSNVISKVFFPTELSVEAFMPPYLSSIGGRPTITSISQTVVILGAVLQVFFTDANTTPAAEDKFLFTMNSSPWTTHSYSQGQRMVTLKPVGAITVQSGADPNLYYLQAGVAIPKYATVLPPSYYMLWVVKNGNPSTKCTWVRITK